MKGPNPNTQYYTPLDKPTPNAAASSFLKPKLYSFAAVTILCSLSYLLGVWQHGAANSPSTTSNLDAAVPCFSITQNNTTTAATATNASSSLSSAVQLDFNTHHPADGGAVTPSSAAKAYPPCSSQYSEYTPCEDQKRSLKFPRDRLIYRERHCPSKTELLKCRIPAPYGYKNPFKWPQSRDLAWFANVPHKELTIEKAGQNWVRFEGNRFRFPGGGTMFPNGAGAYIDDIGKLINLKDGSIRTAIDTGCGAIIFLFIFYSNLMNGLSGYLQLLI